MDLDWPAFARALVGSLVFATLGVILFTLAYVILNAVTPFSLREQLVEKQNVALAIVLASVILGLSFIIASAVGP